MGLLTINSKMKKSNSDGVKVVNFTLPAFRTRDGESTCPNATACVSGCYARQGAYVWSNVSAKHHANYNATKSPLFIQAISSEIKKLKATHVRIHDSGDFYSASYLAKWLAIATMHPEVTFYAYSKMISLLKQSELPANFIVIFSFGGREDNLIDINSDRHAKVFESELPADYVDASNNDLQALTSNVKVGLAFHGNKKWSNTNWGKVQNGNIQKNNAA